MITICSFVYCDVFHAFRTSHRYTSIIFTDLGPFWIAKEAAVVSSGRLAAASSVHLVLSLTL